jgi:hypothetical protein
MPTRGCGQERLRNATKKPTEKIIHAGLAELRELVTGLLAIGYFDL